MDGIPMTGTERMRRWRSNPENRAAEHKRMTEQRRARGIQPQARLTEEEKKVLRRVRARQQYRKSSADPSWRERYNADARRRYAEKKAKAK